MSPRHAAALAVAALAMAALAMSAVTLGGCGGSSTGGSSTPRQTQTVSNTSTTASARSAARTVQMPPSPPAGVQILPAARESGPTGFVAAVHWRGQTAAWIARTRSGITLLSFDPQLTHLALHSGTIDAGGSGPYGPAIVGRERTRLIAAFNGAFKLSTGSGGFLSGGRVGAPLRDGLGSIVTYTDGSTDIGSWHQEVPARGKTIASVRQNLSLLIDHGRAADSLDCLSCWGATLGGVIDPARAAVGITNDGHLIWAGGEHLSVSALADALRGARVVRAVELDINPEWVASYVYAHHRGGRLTPVQVVSGAAGVAGAFLEPYSRDFFSVLAR